MADQEQEQEQERVFPPGFVHMEDFPEGFAHVSMKRPPNSSWRPSAKTPAPGTSPHSHIIEEVAGPDHAMFNGPRIVSWLQPPQSTSEISDTLPSFRELAEMPITPEQRAEWEDED